MQWKINEFDNIRFNSINTTFSGSGTATVNINTRHILQNFTNQNPRRIHTHMTFYPPAKKIRFGEYPSESFLKQFYGNDARNDGIHTCLDQSSMTLIDPCDDPGLSMIKLPNLDLPMAERVDEKPLVREVYLFKKKKPTDLKLFTKSSCDLKSLVFNVGEKSPKLTTPKIKTISF